MIRLFQSTLSLRRATSTSPSSSYSTFYFNPRSPCGERHWSKWRSAMRQHISIHALLAESDFYHPQRVVNHRLFQSTLSLRRATQAAAVPQRLENISIHALLAESDRTVNGRLRTSLSDFNPRSPCGERPPLGLPSRACLISNFNPRSPCGERHLILHFLPPF